MAGSRGGLSSDDIGYLESLTASHGWKVAMEKIIWPMLQMAQEKLDDCKASDAPRYQGEKKALLGFIRAVYRQAGQVSPFDQHAYAMFSRLTRPEMEEGEEMVDREAVARAEVEEMLGQRYSRSEPNI